MSTTYPGSKQSFTDPNTTDFLNSPSHAGLHTDKNDTIEAIQDKIGYTGTENFVLVAGDTMTGTLTISQSALANGIAIVNSATEGAYFSLDATGTNGRNWQIISDANNATLNVGSLVLYDGDTGGTGGVCITIDPSHNIVFGDFAALATNATDKFIYIPTMAGTASGTPTAFTGKVAMVFDTTNNKIGIYDGGWLWTAALA